MEKTKPWLDESDLAALAKQCRLASGKSRAQVARELGVARPSIVYAEDYPQQSLFKLRKRLIETYSPYTLGGPLYRLERRR